MPLLQEERSHQAICQKFKSDRQNNRDKKGKTNSDDEQGNLVDEFNISCDSEIVSQLTQETSWVIDSGATIHGTPHKNLFSSYTYGDYGVVKMGNGNLSKVIGKGDVCVETDNGMKLLLKDVRHIPDMRLNLMSIGKLDDEGFQNSFGNGKWKLTKGSLIIARGHKLSKLYVMQAKVSDVSINVTKNENIARLWHKRLCHAGEKGMSKLVKDKVLPDLDQVSLKKCEDCLAGKTEQSLFP
ncbi:GAG-pre-integrase domain-containing protein [Corynebacterium sp. MC-10]|nr:GAG-pre-integrase domain-containing protein [Corynebacterium parakroppenstedtii]